jgi:hypothetical protein
LIELTVQDCDAICKQVDRAKVPATRYDYMRAAAQFAVIKHALVSLPTEPTPQMINAMLASKANADEDSLPPLMDILDFSGENKSRAVVTAVYRAVVATSKAGDIANSVSADHPALSACR